VSEPNEIAQAIKTTGDQICRALDRLAETRQNDDDSDISDILSIASAGNILQHEKAELDERVILNPQQKLSRVLSFFAELGLPHTEIVQFRVGIHQINVDMTYGELAAAAAKLKAVDGE
jgi:hypothetical protein